MVPMCFPLVSRLCDGFNRKGLSVNGAKRSEQADYVEQSDRKSLCGSIQQCMVRVQTWTILMPNSNQIYVCPVCSYPDLDEPAYDSFGCASYNICPCCGTEFGYDDSTTAHSDLREKWVSEGMQWWSKHKLKPNGWDPVRQLINN